MIISEKQIFTLLEIAETFRTQCLENDSKMGLAMWERVDRLLVNIRKQQSEELGVVADINEKSQETPTGASITNCWSCGVPGFNGFKGVA